MSVKQKTQEKNNKMSEIDDQIMKSFDIKKVIVVTIKINLHIHLF